MSKLIHRRDALKFSAGAGLLFAVSGTKSSGRIIGANDTIRLAVAGVNGRGASHVQEFSNIKGVAVTHLIDPDTRTYAKYMKGLTEKNGHAPVCVQDSRKALEDKNIDAISIATPNHWHSLLTIWGCQAGKDVYVEKPMSHNVAEGKMAVEAARKYNRIVQHGTQGRSSKSWAQALDLIKSGQAGKVLVSRALCYKPRGSIGIKPVSAAPKEIDFDIWTGPAPAQPHHANLVHYNWHWFWDFGNGDIGNQGVHQMDVARWMIPGAKVPKSVVSLGGRFGYKDQGQTANTQITVMDFGGPLLTFEVRGLKTGEFMGEKVGNIIHLEGGTIAGDKWIPKGETKPQPLPKLGEAKRGPGNGNHFANLIEAVRSRKTDDLNADILEGHYSSTCCHLSNISYRLGQPVAFASNSTPFGTVADGNETFTRMRDHLKDDNAISLEGLNYILGPTLKFNASTERFIDAPAADALLSRAGRQGYSVPTTLASL